MKLLATVTFLAGVLGSGATEPLKVADIVHPTREMLNERVQVIGYFHRAEAEDLDSLSSEPARFDGSSVEIVLSKLLLDGPEGNRAEKHNEIGERFNGRKVVLTGILRVGPIGMMQRAEVYLEAEKIEEAEKPVEMARTDLPPATERLSNQWYTRAPALERWDDLLEEQSKEILSKDSPERKETGVGILIEIQNIRMHRRVIDYLGKNRASMQNASVGDLCANYLAALENLADLRSAVFRSHDRLIEYRGYDYRREASPLLISALRDLDSIEAGLRSGLKTELEKSSAPNQLVQPTQRAVTPAAGQPAHRP
jgi:hypothetical protein